MSEAGRSEGMLGRAFDVLLAVAELGSADARSIAERADLPKSTTYRLLAVLVAKGFLQRCDGGFQIGWAPYFLASIAAASATLPHRAEPILRALSKQTGETAIVAIRNDEHFVIVGIAEASQELRTTFPLGTHLPITKGAAGQIFLAYDESELRGSPAVGATRYALSDESVAPGVRAIAAPAFDYLGALSCVIVLAGPSSRLDFTDGLIERVVEAANELSQLLGYQVMKDGVEGT